MPPNLTHCSTPDSPLDSLTASLPFLFYFLLCFPISKVCFWANNCYNHPSSQPATTTVCLSDLPTCHAELFFPFCIFSHFLFCPTSCSPDPCLLLFGVQSLYIFSVFLLSYTPIMDACL